MHVCVCVCICYAVINSLFMSYNVMLNYHMFNLNFTCKYTCYIDGVFQSKFPFQDNKVLF